MKPTVWYTGVDVEFDLAAAVEDELGFTVPEEEEAAAAVEE